MITRKVDWQDASPAGFTYSWVKKIAEQVDQLKVICLEKGDASGLENVEIYSLGKEKGFGKLRKFLRFQKFAWRLVRQADGIFCHQNPEYTILIAPYAKLFGKKIVSWYTHKEVSWRLYLVNLLADKILTASAESCRLKNRKKIEVVGHGIDIQKFKVQSPKSKITGRESKFRILSIGRISPVKDYETLIKAIENLISKDKKIEVQIVGGPVLENEKKYFDNLRQLVKEKKLEEYIKFLGAVPHSQIVPYYQDCDLFINLSQTGSVDKAVLEAMACQKLVLTSNEAFVNILNDQRLLFEPKSLQDLAKKIVNLMNLPPEEKEKIGQQLRDKVVKNHNLDNLVDLLDNNFRSV